MIRRGKQFALFATVGALLIAGCGSDDDSSSDTTGGSATTTGESAPAESAAPETTPSETGETTPATETPSSEGEAPSGDAWTAPVDDCPDADAVTAPIEGELVIGSYQPLSGTPAVAFSPVTEGFKLYLEYANENALLDGVTLVPDIQDDQYDSTQTPGVVESLIDSGVDIISAGIGTPNGLAVRDLLNSECIPQLLNLTGAPEWGEVAEYPWTTGGLVPYDIEAEIYAQQIAELYGEGATVGLFTVNNEFGKIMDDTFTAAAEEAGLEIVTRQTIQPEDEAPPANQVGQIADANPDAILAVPLGAQCPRFLTEVANAKAANDGWDPGIFLTNTCSSRLLISQLAGGNGNGVYTSYNLIDPGDPKNADLPEMQAFADAYSEAGLTVDFGTAGVGWTMAEATVNILKQAQETGTLSRQSIIEAARNLEFVPSLARAGTVYKMNGETDPFAFQTLTVLQWDEASGTFTEIGEADTSHES